MVTDRALEFYRNYLESHDEYVAAAELAQALVVSALRNRGFHLHQVSQRAKEPQGLLEKIRRNGYADPARQVADLVGVRVVTYFRDEVDEISAALRDSFEVDGRSTDKREKLGVGQFGYRSVHLIVRAKLSGVERGAKRLADLLFEIQIRSLLDHAWAEFEHNLVYKTGIIFPDETLRELNGLAAQLEAVDGRFLELRSAKHALIGHYKEAYQAGEELDADLDLARLCGLLEALQPEGLGFREAEMDRSPFSTTLQTACLQCILARGLNTARAVQEALRDNNFQARVENYASLSRITTAEASHLALCVLLGAHADPAKFMLEFPDLLLDNNLESVIDPTRDQDAPE